MGMGDRSFLSHTLISIKKEKDFVTFSGQGQLDKVSTMANCIRSNELGITGDLEAEWDQF